MKKNVKVVISFLTLLSILATPVSVFATLTEQITDFFDFGQKVEVKMNREVEAKGNLEVDLDFTLPIQKERENIISLTLKDENGNEVQLDINLQQNQEEKTVFINGKEIKVTIQKFSQDRKPVLEEEYRYLNIKFSELPLSNYQIQLKGNGFLSYESPKVELQDYSKRIYLSNLKGTFAIGDVNQDGSIDEKDYGLLVNQIGSNEISDLVKYDLNCDGIINIIDLSYIAKNINREEKLVNIENTDPILKVDNINKVTTSEKTQIEGNVEDILEGTAEVVGLKAKEGEKISEKNPVAISMELKQPMKAQKVTIMPNVISDANVPTKLELEVETVEGEKIVIPYEKQKQEVMMLSAKSSEDVITINLGKQVAIKKITIKILETKNNTNLAEIAQVEFLNNVYEEIPAPKMDIPEGIQVVAGSEKLTVNWRHTINVTGYKVKITGGGKDNVFETTKNTLDISDLKNYTEYVVSVESVNGTWESGYSQEVKGTPIPNRKPPVPENINLTGKNQRIDVSWKNMKDTQNYNVYYRKTGENEYQKVSNINGTSYTINHLEDKVEYEVCISGNNHLGEGKKSANYKATTIAIEAPVTRNYKLINTSNGTNKPTAHIANISYPQASVTEDYDVFDIVDNDYSSYWRANTWDIGGLNAWKHGPIVEFDKNYKMDSMIVVAADFQPYNYDYCKIQYWDQDGNSHMITNANVQRKISTNGKLYYDFKLKEPIEAKKIQINFASSGSYYGNEKVITIAEMKFYYYDDIEKQVSDLFKDDLRIELSDGVTEEKIGTLIQRVNTQDPVSQEYHPNREILLKDLEYAKNILQDTQISEIMTVDQQVNNGRNSHLGFSYTMNDYQPLGIVANARDEIALYVGTQNANVNLEVIFTQYFPESGSWKQVTKNLQKGQNIITVPQITSMDVEKGGSVYVRYTNKEETKNPIKIRVSGGSKIPVLDLHDVTDETIRKECMNTYLTQLKTYVASLTSVYAQKGQTYQEATSILNSTEIVLDDVILSVPASKVLQGLTSGLTDTNAQITRLDHTTKAFDEMLALFYKEKGLTKNSSDPKNEWPGSRIGIRYTRMFDGAFMYAGGEHIGIGLGSVAGLMKGMPATQNVDGTSETGYFGWGIAHEIGHVIDQNGMAKAEITNNIYSLFAQTADDKTKSRLETSGKYEEIYQKVTSHTTGISSNVFVSLGMYWQLHLAYDNEPTLTSTNTFYARLNTLYRNNTLGNDVDQTNKLIRLASDAAGKNLTDFFETWGLKANEETKAYLKEKGYEKETRPIYYLNDDARRYRLNGGTKLQTTLTANMEAKTGEKQIKLTFGVASGADKMLGYEIRRNGESVGFTTSNEYVDELNALNNRVFTYEVIAYDKLLNKVDQVTLDPVKVEHDGTIYKNNFTVTSNMRNDQDENEYENDHVVKSSIEKAIDQDTATIFQGNTKKVSSDKANPYMIIDLNDQLPVCGLRYTAGVQNGSLVENTIRNYKVYVSQDRENWDLVKIGKFNVAPENPVAQIYFDAPGSTGGNQLYTSISGYVKIEAVGSKGISAAELDLISPPGDNISLAENDIYVLEKDYQYAQGKENIIPAGSVVIKAEYRGNPAYNAALLIDANGNTVENYSQIFMAELPENATLDEIASGYWIAYFTKESYEEMLKAKQVKLQLYRVNHAETLEGQRLVSDTFLVSLKEYHNLPKIELKDEN